jgi:hypothetical protein
MFRGQFTMNDPCPGCGLILQREEGYFLGALYASYLLAVALILPLYLIAWWLLAKSYFLLAPVVALVAYLPFMPAVFRYSRVLWVYFDRSMCPTDVSAGPVEKVLQQQQASGPHEVIAKD